MPNRIHVIYNAAFGRRVRKWLSQLNAAPVSVTLCLPIVLAIVMACEPASTSPEAAAAVACDDAQVVPVGEVQGTGLQSPMLNERVTVSGVVTQVIDGVGFYLQEPQADSDQNPNTSDALWIEPDINALPDITDHVQVSGTVQELTDTDNLTDRSNDTHTAIIQSSWSRCAIGQRLPVVSPTRMDHEAFEHMLVELKDWQVSGRDRHLIRVSSEQLLLPTQVVSPGRAARQLQKRNLQHSVYLSTISGTNWQAGDQLTLYGIVVANASKPSLDLAMPPKITKATPEKPAPDKPPNIVRLASMNVENLFNGNGKGGGFPTRRGAKTAKEYADQLQSLVSAVEELEADILAVMELENDGYKRNSTIAQFAQALNAESRRRNWQFISPGSAQLGDDVITVGLLYDSNRVNATGRPETLTIRPFDGLSRVPLAQRFAATGSKSPFWVAVNHFKSKGGCPRGSGRNADKQDGQGCWNEARERSSTTLSRWLKDLQRSSGVDAAMIVGDLNSYHMEDPVQALIKAKWVDLPGHYNPAPIYSYRYQGQLGALDHAFGNQPMLNRVVSAGIWNSNSDVIDRRRSKVAFSDHDPVFVDIALD